MSKVLLSILPLLPLLLSRDAHESRADRKTEGKNIFEISNEISQKIFAKILTSILAITILVFSLTRLALAAENYLIANLQNGHAIANAIYFLIVIGALISGYAIRAKSVRKSHKETPTANPPQISIDKLLIEFISGFQEGLNKKNEAFSPPPDNVYPYPGPANPKRMQ